MMTTKLLQRSFLPQFVYGGIDGTITTFAIIAGVLGANIGMTVILILGFANLFADGFSMAVSSYLSAESREGLKENNQRQHAPRNDAIVTFAAFVLMGLIPLLPFVLAAIFALTSSTAVILSCLATIIAFALIGAGKAYVTDKTPVRAVIETVLIGGIAAVIAFGVGYLLRGLA
jgi:VIT1/CCC1 family predicted Fe2+/Mn2+ transporter